MKKLLLIIASVLFSINIYAQSANASSSVAAKITNPIGITKNTDMNFGVIGVGTGGDVVLSTASVRSATGALLYGQTGTVSASKFTVTGEAGMTYSISIPSTITLSDGAAHSMTVKNFEASATAGGAAITSGTISGTNSQTVSATGTSDLYVGATLTVGASQTSGVYNGTYAVTVNYN